MKTSVLFIAKLLKFFALAVLGVVAIAATVCFWDLVLFSCIAVGLFWFFRCLKARRVAAANAEGADRELGSSTWVAR